MHPALTAAIAGVFGLLIGSFVNVVVWRVPRHESVVRPGSHCPTCSTPIAWFDNVPVVSWIVRRGRCRHCRGRISIRYPLVEVATGVAFAIVGWRFAGDIVVVPMLVLTGCLVALCAIDIDHLLLPNRVLYPSAAMVVPLFVLAAGVDDAWSSLGRAALGAVVSFAVFYALWFVAPGAMGFGDVRLVTLLGFAAAYFGWSTLVAALVAPFVFGAIGGIAVAAPVVLAPMAAAAIVGWVTGVSVMTRIAGGVTDTPARARATVAVTFSVLVGSIVYLVLSALGRVERGRHIPFGPYLALGALAAMLVHG